VTQSIACACGKVVLEVSGRPIIATECHCTSCRTAGERLSHLPGALQVRGPNNGTPYVLYRKDRVLFAKGTEWLREFRLTPDSHTRRVVAVCCNTPLFTEFQDGHWLSIYGRLWPEGTMPAMEIRTQVGDLPQGASLDGSLPSGTRHTLQFYGKLLGAWIAMGFKVPKIDVKGEIAV
jgi:hypothetical protein